MTAQYCYPFGSTAITGSSFNALEYTGRENDSTELYYYRARYYSPQWQRFISEDPIGFAGGVNFYAYVSDVPTMSNDSYGLCGDQKFSISLYERSAAGSPGDHTYLDVSETVGGATILNDVLEGDRKIKSHPPFKNPFSAAWPPLFGYAEPVSEGASAYGQGGLCGAYEIDTSRGTGRPIRTEPQCGFFIEQVSLDGKRLLIGDKFGLQGD